MMPRFLLQHGSLSSGIAAVLLFVLVPSWAIGTPEEDKNTIRRQSQEFSDASASGNAKILDLYLDNDVVFMEESGQLDTKQDIVGSAKAPPDGMSNRLTQSDFTIQLHGDVAVTSFTDNATTSVFGQKSTSRFRSTEVWLREKGTWKMISSQTLALPEDPPPLAWPAAKLAEYVGTYGAGPKLKVIIGQTKGALTTSTNGATASPLSIEAPDILFVAGQPRQRRVFARDATGRIIGFSTRRDGHDIIHFIRQS